MDGIGKFRKRNTGERSINLCEEDVIHYMNEQFELLTSNRRGSAGLRNSKLVTNIIDKFSKIFGLWDENRLFQRTIERPIFEKIYKNMANVFGTELNKSGNTGELQFFLTCKLCDATFPLRNLNCVYSFECHKISKKHKEFLKSLKTGGDTVSVRDNFDGSKTDLQMESEATIKNAGYAQLFVYARCYLCSEHIIKYDPLKYMEDDAVGCSVLAHLKSIPHRENSKLLQDNQQHIESVCAETFLFRCKLCKIVLFLDEMTQHLRSAEHLSFSLANDIIDKYIENMSSD